MLRVKSDLKKALIAVTLSALVAGCGSESSKLGTGVESGSGPSYNSERTYVIKGQIPLTRSTSGVAGIPVIAKEYNPVNPNSKVYRGSTDSNGNFEIKVDHPGTYVVMADAGRRGRAIRTVEVRTDSNVVDLGQIHLTAVGDIEGTLTDSGDPVMGVFVYIPGTSFVAVTDKTGHFKLSDVPVNEGSEGYRLIVRSGSFGIMGIIQLDPLTPNGIQFVKDLAQVEPRLLRYEPVHNEYVVDFNNSTYFMRNFERYEDDDSNGYEGYYGFYAGGGDSDEPKAPGFRLSFDKPMYVDSLFNATEIIDESNQTINVGDKSELIEIYKEWEGEYKVYINSEKLKPGRYTLKIDKAKAKSVFGVNLAEDVLIPFRVGDFGGDIEGSVREAGIGIDEPVKIFFSAPVDRDSVINNLSVQDSSGNDPEGLKFYFSPDNMTVYISAVFKEGETYRFSFKKDIKTFDGYDFLNFPKEATFEMVKPGASLWTGSNNFDSVPKDSEIGLSFNVLMDRDSVERNLRVVDETENKEVNYSLSWYSDYIYTPSSHYYSPPWCGNSADSWCSGDVSKPAFWDMVDIKFKKEYGHTYKVVLENATSAKGTPLDKLEVEFTVLTPKLIGVDVQNGEVIEPYESIEIYSNVPVNDKRGTYDIKFIGNGGETVPGVLDGNSIKPSTPLKTDSEYVLTISKLQSVDGYDLVTPDKPFMVTVKTFRKHIVGSFPHGGQSWVCDGNHHVVIDWNAALTDEEKEALKEYIRVDAYPYYTHGSGTTPTHPDVNVVFGTWGVGQTRMYVDFTWDPDTNYRVYFGDTNGTIITDIPVEDENGNVTGHLYPDKVIVFTTAPEEEYEKTSFITGTWPHDGETVGDIGDIMTVSINTHYGWCCSGLSADDMDIEVKECDIDNSNCTRLYEGEDYQIDVGYENNIYIDLEDVDFYKKYEITVKKLIPQYDWAKNQYIYPDGSDESTFYRFSFFTAGPKLWVNVNNSDGFMRISGNAWFNVKELKDNLKLQPSINCSWSDNASLDDSQEFVRELTCYYKPVQYANVGIDITSKLKAYEPEEVFDNATNSTTVEFNPIGNFENTPLEQVCTVNPDITLPKLEKVEVVENNPYEKYAVLKLTFNERLDADSVKSANFTVSYQDGNSAVGVDSNSTQFSYCNDLETCVSPEVLIRLKDYIRPGITYTVKVEGVKEFGGHYEISDEDGTKTFKYTGKFTGVHYAGYRYEVNGTSKYRLLFVADADVPLLGDQTLTYDLSRDHQPDVNIDLDTKIDYDFHKVPDSVKVVVGGEENSNLGLVADYTVSYYDPWGYEIASTNLRNIRNSANETLPAYIPGFWWRTIPFVNDSILTPQVLNATEDGIFVSFGTEPKDCVFDNSIYTLLECNATDTENCTESSITVQSVEVANSTQNVYLLKTSSILDNSTIYKLQVENLLGNNIDFPCEALKPFGIEEVRESDPFQLSDVSGNGTGE